MNVYDSDRISTALVRRGWNSVTEENDADLIIVVGCSIRSKAEQKVWSDLGRYSKPWEKEKRPVIALTGCIAQNLGKSAMSRFPWVRVVSGPRHIGYLPDALEKVMKDGVRVSLLDENPCDFFDLDEFTLCRSNPFKAFLTIAHGCDNFCTYCIVPYVRGRFFSRPPEDIMKEAESLIKDGVREITLLGQNVNSYGKDFKNGYGFSSLLRDVANLNGLGLVRFVTSLPQDFTEDIVQVMASEPAVCPSINLPVQAGNDRILKLMNRKYTREEYFKKVEMIRSALPDLGLTSDLIVGFPSETEDEFSDSVRALEEIRFDMVHTAAYSEREGTPAATMPGALPQAERLNRLTRINAVQDAITLSINKGLVGRRYRVLADGTAIKGDGFLQGRTPTDKMVVFQGSEELLGRFVEVDILAAESWCLHGELAGTE